MRILAFDCAGVQCAGAVVVDGQIAAARRIAAERGHAQLLLPLLCELLADARLTFRDIHRYAVTTGPGSFTGIRVALAAARGLALATAAPIIGITVFEAFAAAAVEAGFDTNRLLVAVESKRAESFVQLFDLAGNPISAPATVAPDQLLAWAGTARLTIAGDAARHMARYLPGAAILGEPDAPAWIEPAILARIAHDRIIGPAPAPFYLRQPDAVPR